LKSAKQSRLNQENVCIPVDLGELMRGAEGSHGTGRRLKTPKVNYGGYTRSIRYLHHDVGVNDSIN